MYPTQYIYLAHGNSKGEARGRNGHRINATVVRNLEERNVGTKEKSPKQSLASAKDLTIELPEGHHRLDQLTNLTYSLTYGP